MEVENLRYAVPAPRPNEDAASDYLGIVQARSRGELEQWMRDTIGESDGAAAKTGPAVDGGGTIAGPAGGRIGAASQALRSGIRGAINVATDVGMGAAEAPAQIAGGVIDAVSNIHKAIMDMPIGPLNIVDKAVEAVAPGLEQSIIDAITPAEADTATGGFIRASSQFLTTFLPAMKGLQGVGLAGSALATAGRSMSAGAVADLLAFDPHQARLSTFLNQIPALEPFVSDYLADNNPDNETAWEGRLKNAMEGIGIGLASEALFKAFTFYKVARQSKMVAPGAVDAADKAAKMAVQDASSREFVQEISDADLVGLGEPQGGMFIEARPNETAANAFKRVKDAETRAAAVNAGNQALDAINAIRERFAAKGGAAAVKAGRDPLDEMLDLLRSGTPQKALPGTKRPAFDIVTRLGGIDPGSSLAADLRAQGVNARTMPGLFKKGGLKALDNVSAADHEIFSVRGVNDGNGYVPQGSIVEALRDEMNGKPWMTADAAAYQADMITPLNELDAELSKLGIDLSKTSNASVRQIMQDVQDEAARFAAMRDVPQNLGDEAARPEAFDPSAELDPNVRSEADLIRENADRGFVSANDWQAVAAPERPKIYINLARINSADDVKATLQALADQDAATINAKRGGEVVTNAQTVRASAHEYRQISDLLGRDPGPMTAAQAVASRRLLAASGEQVVQLARAAQAAGATPADLYAFRRAMAVHYAIQSEVIAARTETARALQSWKIPAGATKARAEAVNDLIMQAGGAGDIQQLARAVAVAGETGVNAMARELGRGRFGKALYQVWINGLLSSPKTHMVNVLSNSMVAAYAIPERYVAAGISKAFYGGEIQAGEATAQAFGLVRGVRDGFRLAYMGNKAAGIGDLADVFDAFVKSESTHNAFSAKAFGLNDAGSMGQGIDFLGKIVNLPGSALQAEDRFFKAIGYRMELNALAYRQAAKEGLDGEGAAKRIAEILSDPPAALQAEALDVAHYQTFTNKLSPGMRQIMGGIGKHPVAGPVQRLVAPFIRTPTNIMKYTFQRTPLAYMSGAIRADIAAGGARAAQAHARVALGTMIMMVTMDMTAEGTITGRGPVEPSVRKAWLADGNMPYSVKIGDRRYQYSRLDPIGMLMGFAADTSAILSNASEDDADMLVAAGVVALANNLANKTYMSGVFDLIEAIDPANPTSDFGKYLTGQAGTIVPFSSFMRHMAGTLDPTVRETRTNEYMIDPETGKPTAEPDQIASFLDTLVNQVKRGIPGQSDTLPPMRDLFGEPITRASGIGWAWDFLSPVASIDAESDPVARVIVDNRVSISPVPRQIEGVKLSAEQYSEFQELAGKPLKEHLAKMVETAGFKRLSEGPDGMKAEIIKDAVNTYRGIARAQMMARHPDLRATRNAIIIERNRSLAGGNND